MGILKLFVHVLTRVRVDYHLETDKLLLLLFFCSTGNGVNESNGSTVVKPLLEGDDVKELEEQQGTTSV